METSFLLVRIRSCALGLTLALAATALTSDGCFALTTAQVITRARSYLRDTSSDTTRQQFSDATLLGWVNDGTQEANSYSWVLRSSMTFTLAAATTEYALPDNFLATWRVEFSGRKIDQTSINELDTLSIGWKSARGPPQKYYLYTSTATWIGFTPVPTSASTGTVAIYYMDRKSVV